MFLIVYWQNHFHWCASAVLVKNLSSEWQGIGKIQYWYKLVWNNEAALPLTGIRDNHAYTLMEENQILCINTYKELQGTFIAIK